MDGASEGGSAPVSTDVSFCSLWRLTFLIRNTVCRAIPETLLQANHNARISYAEARSREECHIVWRMPLLLSLPARPSRNTQTILRSCHRGHTPGPMSPHRTTMIPRSVPHRAPHDSTVDACPPSDLGSSAQDSNVEIS